MRGTWRRVLRKAAVGTVGGFLVVAGLVLMPLPGPGTVVLVGGLAVLQTEYPAAGRLLLRIKKPVARWGRALGIAGRSNEDGDRGDPGPGGA